MLLRQLLLIATSLIFSTNLLAQNDRISSGSTIDPTVVKGNTYAIIIGISEYKLVPSLQYAHKDAEAFEAFLLSEAGGNVPKSNIETFLNEKANRNNVADAISIIARKAKQGDRVYFFFAGHGDMEDLTQIENGLLLLYNSPHGNYFGMKDDVLEILDLKRYLSPLSQRGIQMIFIVDACHSGNLKGGVEGVQQTASALAASWGKEYKILSCQPNQVSLESREWGGGRGLFSLQLEEGLKGLADKNNDGKVSFSELQRYITDQVATFSEEKQIPVVTGDLSKPFVNVNPSILAALKKQKAENYPLLAIANTKGSEEKYIDSLDDEGKKIYFSFNQNLGQKNLIWPKDTNSLNDYRLFLKKYGTNPVVVSMRRNLAAALNERFNNIVGPLLKGETSYSTRDECYYAAAELDSCLSLLGDQHYMFRNLKARKLYMNAMSLTWGLSDNEYNISWNPTIQKAINYLEESAELESNAAYTFAAMGINYNLMFEYEKADDAFQKYLDLRPNNLYANWSLGLIRSKLKQYEKAEIIFESLLNEYPDNLDLKGQLVNIYSNNNKSDKALKLIDGMIAVESERFAGYFSKGILYSKSSIADSAIYYYNKAKENYAGYLALCDNNIGHVFFVNGQYDSARKYFNSILSYDSTFAHAHFNLGVIEEKEGNISEAINQFLLTTNNATASLDGFITNMQLYFGKTYTNYNESTFNAFKKKVYNVNMQYISYVSMMYAYIRVPGFIDSTANINYIFDLLKNYKQEDMWTWYHHACWKSLKKDKTNALGSLEKSLQLGFGDYYMIMNDRDLDSIRETTKFQELLKKYFPDKHKKE